MYQDAVSMTVRLSVMPIGAFGEQVVRPSQVEEQLLKSPKVMTIYGEEQDRGRGCWLSLQ